MDDFVWMRHPETGGLWQCPVDAIEHWLARGWVPAEGPPEEPDATKDPHVRTPDPRRTESADETAAERDKPTARAPRRMTAAANEEKE